MKTAVSIPDATFQEADRLAQQLGVSRSELYARALQALLKTQREAAVTQALNRVYAEDAEPADERTFRREAARRTLERGEW